MKTTRFFFNAALLSGLALGMFACSSKEDIPAPTTDVQIVVRNEATAAVAGATVNLYGSKTDWELEQNALRTAVTDNSGVAKFSALDPEKQYFYDVRKDYLNNWKSDNAVVTIKDQTVRDTTIAENNVHAYCASAAGKKWTVESITTALGDVTGLLLPACSRDDSYTFFKNLIAVRDEEATKCDEADPQTEENIYDVNGMKLIFNFNGNEVELTVTSATETKIIGTVPVPELGFTVTVTLARS